MDPYPGVPVLPLLVYESVGGAFKGGIPPDWGPTIIILVYTGSLMGKSW